MKDFHVRRGAHWMAMALFFAVAGCGGDSGTNGGGGNGGGGGEQYGDANFYDLYFEDYVADPVAEVKKMYARFGHELSVKGEQALRAQHEANPQHKHGKHVYSDKGTGLTEAEIYEAFGPYMDSCGFAP